VILLFTGPESREDPRGREDPSHMPLSSGDLYTELLRSLYGVYGRNGRIYYLQRADD